MRDEIFIHTVDVFRTLGDIMFGLFQYPLHSDSLESWAKNLDDIAKVAILALPVILYSDKGMDYRLFNSVVLFDCCCICLYMADYIRKYKDNSET